MTKEQEIAMKAKVGGDYSLIRTLVIALLVLVVVLGSVLVYVVTRNTNTVGKEQVSIDAQKTTAARTECVRQLSNDLNDKRWNALASVLEASKGRDIPSVNEAIDQLKSYGGILTDEINKACPGAISDGSPPVSIPVPGGK